MIILFLFQIVLSALCVVAFCKPAQDGFVKVSQDTAGNYDIQYETPEGSRRETNNNGVVTGSYSYLDGNGILQTVHYTAGPQGFVILDGSNIPAAPVAPLSPVRNTPEVEEARRQHLALHAAEAARGSAWCLTLKKKQINFTMLYRLLSLSLVKNLLELHIVKATEI